MSRRFLCLVLAGFMAACGQVDPDPAAVPAPTPQQIAYAEDVTPSDPILAEKYDRSCRACHSFIDADAPLTGHNAAWKMRLDAKGTDGLLATTRTGLGAMPAKGQCPDCTEADFRALIDFMMQEAP